jgi:predicted MFS family arabinose efflux permease
VRPLYLAAPVTGLLLALVPLAHTGDVRPSAAGELIVYYALALAVAAPGLGLLERSRAHAAQRLVESG